MDSKIYTYNFAEVDGKVEIIEFFDSLNTKEQAKIKAGIDKLIEQLNNNNYPNAKSSKYLRDGIFELKVQFINTNSRSLYFFIEGKPLFLLMDLLKKQKQHQLLR